MRKAKITIHGVSGDQERLAVLQQEAAKLEKKLARGTQDVTKEAAAAFQVGGPLAERLEIALRAKPHSIDELVRELGESAGKISAAMRGLRKHLWNAGTEDMPAWFWIVGDEAPTDQVNEAIETLVTYRPMRFQELLAATGVRPGRVSGAIVKMQREPGSQIVNLNGPTRARWFVVPEQLIVAKLAPR